MNTFPLEFSKHVGFCIIAIAFFLFQFYRQGFKYQLLTAAAIGATLLLYVNDSSGWRYGIGIIEAVLLVLIFVIMAKEKKNAEKKAQAEKDNKASDSAPSEAPETAVNGEGKNE
ncbi:MAG: hypothetical protein E7505_06735 [Ruminococcus sp.]|jgi:hypothetical protein|nr:hypothetical protein [Ruminococcus sp.]